MEQWLLVPVNLQWTRFKDIEQQSCRNSCTERGKKKLFECKKFHNTGLFFFFLEASTVHNAGVFYYSTHCFHVINKRCRHLLPDLVSKTLARFICNSSDQSDPKRRRPRHKSVSGEREAEGQWQAKNWTVKLFQLISVRGHLRSTWHQLPSNLACLFGRLKIQLASNFLNIYIETLVFREKNKVVCSAHSFHPPLRQNAPTP